MRFSSLLTALLLFALAPCFGQTHRIAQLKAAVQQAGTPAEKQTALLQLCDQGYTLHPDSLMAYAIQAEALAQRTGHLRNETEARFYRSYALTNKGLIDSSLALAESCEAVLKKSLNDPVLLASVQNQKGRCYMRKNLYKEAVGMAYAVIGNAEKGGNVLLQIKGKTLMGWAYLEMGQAAEALRWHLEALHTTGDEKIREQYGILFANLALNYSALKKPDSAFYYIGKAVAYSRKNENLFALSNSLAIQAQLLVNTGQPQRAEAPLKEVIRIRQLIGDPFYIVSDMAQLAFLYAGNGQTKKGAALAGEGLALVRKYNINTKLFLLYSALAANHRAAGDLPAYARVMEQILAWKDSVYQSNSAEAMAEMKARFNLQKKENIIIQQQLDLVRKNYWLFGALLFFALIAAGAYMLYRADKRKQQLKLQLIQKEETRKAEQAVREAEEAERKRIAADLHDSLGAYAAAIAANIDLLQSHLPPPARPALHELRSNARAIVAQLNDTIWVLKKDSLSLTAIADRLKSFIQQMNASYPHVLIDVEEHIDQEFLLPPLHAFHLFQIVREAVINALRHSRCSQLTIHLEAGRGWRFSIADNGRGFLQKTTVAEGGNGLANMQQRARESGYRVQWTGNQPQGTKVTIEPTTN